jgi:hypothetical protein
MRSEGYPREVFLDEVWTPWSDFLGSGRDVFGGLSCGFILDDDIRLILDWMGIR